MRIEPAAIARARAFKADLEKRGTRLIFMLVPSPDIPRARAFALGEAVGVPVVAPRPDNPRTIDGSHLTQESAEVFSEALLRELAPLVRKGLSAARTLGG